MDEENSNVKPEVTECLYVCKCCLEDDNLQDLWAEYLNDDQLEIYGESLNNCFNLSWHKPFEEITEWICNTCMERIKHAAYFKANIEESAQLQMKKKKSCKCCLQNQTKLKKLWTATQFNGEVEVIGEKLAECFGLPWTKPLGGMEYVCESCIGKLEHAALFKMLIEVSENKLAEHYQLESPSLKSKMETEQIGETLNESSIEMKIEAIDNNINIKQEVEDDKILLEVNENGEFIVMQIDDDQDQDSVLEESLSSNNDEKTKKTRRDNKRKSVKNYPPEVMELAIEACMKGERTTADSARYYRIPVASLRTKLNKVLPPIDGKVTYSYEDDDDNGDASKEQPVWMRNKQKKAKKTNRTNKNYPPEVMEMAVSSVIRGEMRIADAARHFNLPLKTVNFKVFKQRNNIGPIESKIQKTQNELIAEVKTLLSYTNVMPYRSRTTRFYCAYCPSDSDFFEDPDDLRQHTIDVHEHQRISEVDSMLYPPWYKEILKVDIENLQCTDCSIGLRDWNTMFLHLSDVHDVSFELAHKRVIPYLIKKNDINCALCMQNFSNYSVLDIHMNLHYDSYMCAECSMTFMTKHRLFKHEKCHEIGRFPCPVCGKVFTQKNYRKKHVEFFHKKQMLVKCVYCSEVCNGLEARCSHIEEFHPGRITKTTCNICGVTYNFRHQYLVHLRKKHGGTSNSKQMDQADNDDEFD